VTTTGQAKEAVENKKEVGNDRLSLQYAKGVGPGKLMVIDKTEKGSKGRHVCL